MAKADWVAPTMTIAEVEAAVARGVGWSTSDATQLAKIDEAITAVGQAAATWEGRGHYWSRGKAQFAAITKTVATVANSGAVRSSNVTTFTTTAVHGLAAGQDVQVSGVTDSTFDGVFRVVSAPTTSTITVWNPGDNATSGAGTLYVISYPLRTVQSNAMQDLYSVLNVWVDDDYELSPLSESDYNSMLVTTDAISEPTAYCVFGEAPLIGFQPTPDTSSRIFTVSYLKLHSKITSAGSNDAALIVPAPFHWPVYVNGATWLLKQEKGEPASLRQCPQFVEAMGRMGTRPGLTTDDMYPDAKVGHVPGDHRVIDGVVMNWPTL